MDASIRLCSASNSYCCNYSNSFSVLFGENTSATGWVTSDLLGWFLLLAFLAGIVGHTGLNACLRWLQPLTISFAVTLEPIIGAFIGWLLFDGSVPQMDLDRWNDTDFWNYDGDKRW